MENRLDRKDDEDIDCGVGRGHSLRHNFGSNFRHKMINNTGPVDYIWNHVFL